MSFYDVIGRLPHDVLWWQACLRAVIVFVVLLVLIKLGGTRAFGKNTAFDIVVGIMLGSTLSRAINGSAPLPQTLAASATLVLLHWVGGRLAFHSHAAGRFIKGQPVQLVADGRRDERTCKHLNITERDLVEALRMKDKSEDLSRIKDAFLERSGEITIIPYG